MCRLESVYFIKLIFTAYNFLLLIIRNEIAWDYETVSLISFIILWIELSWSLFPIASI